jgi:peptidoglycan/xylan/chitin deacetylase (PgdA/CDA1 family)
VGGVPIFVYHDFVANEAARAQASPAHRPYVLTQERFAAHLDVLAAAGGRACRVREALRAAPAGGFVLTFDDGAASDFSIAFPMLRAREWTGCFFVIAGAIGTPGCLGWSELRSMADAGMEIGSHSLTHPHVQHLTRAAIEHEFRESKRILEDGLGRPVTVASLPRGTAPRGMAALIEACGYETFCTSEPGLVGPRSNRLRLPRIAVKSGTTPAFVARVLQGRATTMTALHVVHALKAVGKQVVGAERWRRMRGAIIATTAGRGTTRGA